MAKFPRFSEFPNELKLQIIETTNPEDIVNLALSCKAVFILATETLAQHRYDKAHGSFLSFSVKWALRHKRCLEVFHKVQNIATNRRWARYIKHITIQCRSLDRDVINPPIEPDTQGDIVQVCSTIFKDFASPYIKEEEVHLWYERLIDGIAAFDAWNSNDANATIVKPLLLNFLLLNFLPNVECIVVDWPSQAQCIGIAKALRAISAINQDAPASHIDQLSLTKLSEVYIRDTNMVEGPGVSDLVDSFMALPSLRSLRLSMIWEHFEFNEWLNSTPHPNLTEIHCRCCRLEVTQLARLLNRVKPLRVFSYDHLDFTTHGQVENELRPGAFLDLLFQHSGASLTYLNFTTNARHDLREIASPVGPVGSFRGFAALKTIRLRNALLLPDTKRDIAKKLVDELPASVEELEIVERLSRKEARRMFAGMLDKKQERLPNLAYVAFEGKIPFNKRTVRAYERVGVTMDWRMQDHENRCERKFHKTGKMWLGNVRCPRLEGP